MNQDETRAEIAHMPRRTVSGPDELTLQEKQLTGASVKAFKPMVHALVVNDAEGGNTWDAVRVDQHRATHCAKCAGLTLGAAIAIIAELAYKVDPEMTRANFAERYAKLIDKS